MPQCNGITRKGHRCSRVLPITEDASTCMCYQHKHDDGQECPICFESLKTRKKVMTTSCNHKFHTTCMKKWLGSNDTCPCCRENLKMTNTQQPIMIFIIHSEASETTTVERGFFRRLFCFG